MKKVKFLNVLILAITLNFGIFVVADATAKNEKKVEEKNMENNSEKEEEAKAQEKTKKYVEKYEKLEEEQIEKNKKTYENFKKEDYEVEGFNLEVFWKNGVPILHYVHKKTKAQFVFIPIEEDKNIILLNSVFFKKLCSDDSGIVHISEHCFGQETENKHRKLKGKNCEFFNAQTTPFGLEFLCSSQMFNYEHYLKDLLKALQDPEVFKNPKMFEVEKKRVINEIKFNKRFKVDNSSLDGVLYYEFGGDVDNIKKLKLKDLKKFHSEYVNPSNMCIVEYVDLFKKDIKKHLKDINNVFLKNFTYKEVYSKFSYKQKEKYSKLKAPSCSDFVFYNDKNKEDKFKVCLTYDLNKFNFNAVQKEAFNIDFDRIYNEELYKAIKKLGYSNSSFSTNTIDNIELSKGCVKLFLTTNDENLVKEDVLNKNAKKILELFKNELKQKDYSYLIYIKPSVEYFINSRLGKDGLRFANSHVYDGFVDIANKIKQSYARFKKPFSKNIFNVNENNEITHNLKYFIDATKNNLGVYDILAKKGPHYITVFEKDNSKKGLKDSVKFKHEVFSLPIKFNKINKSKSFFYLACGLFNSFLTENLGREKGLTYSEFSMPPFFSNVVSRLQTNEQSKKEILEYVNSNFSSLIRNFKLSRKEFDSFKEKEKARLKQGIKYGEDYVKKIRNFEKEIYSFCNSKGYLKNSIINKNMTVLDFMSRAPYAVNSLLNYFNSHEDYLKNLKFLYENLKYRVNFKNKDKILVNKNIVKKISDKLNFKEHERYNINFVKILKELYRGIDYVTYEEVLKTIKSASLLDENELKNIEKNDEFENKLKLKESKIKF